MWGTTKVVGATRGPGEAGEVGDEGMTQVLAVRPPKVVVGPLAFVRGGGEGVLTTHLCSEGGLTTWAHGLTAQMHSQTTRCGQRWKAWWNTGRLEWCGHGSRTGRVIL
jgi:hypothetical protein